MDGCNRTNGTRASICTGEEKKRSRDVNADVEKSHVGLVQHHPLTEKSSRSNKSPLNKKRSDGSQRNLSGVGRTPTR